MVCSCLQRMLQRGISRDAVKYVLCNGEMIENYPEETPFVNALFFGIWQNKPLHVVISFNYSEPKIFLVTSYWPDKEHFENDFKTRRK
ncbi:MAG: DUF4258 domain-containing protein [Nitrospinae bacterium]|nr:DUF4258 domain-containing protein [Nitrospinota bacterium]